jgi:hypothetical protein
VRQSWLFGNAFASDHAAETCYVCADEMGFGSYASLAAIVLLSACARAERNTDDPPRDFRIQLERTSCFGFCPEYIVEVDHSGLVSFQGNAFVKKRGAASWRVSPASLAIVARDLRDEGIFDLSEEKIRADCDPAEAATDSPSAILSATAWGRTVKLSHYLGCPRTRTLRTLEIACIDIDAALGTDKIRCEAKDCRDELAAQRKAWHSSSEPPKSLPGTDLPSAH